MDTKIVGELYEIIKNESGNLIEKYYDKFLEFYNDRFSLLNYVYNEPKIYTILEYILKNSNGAIFEYEISNLLNIFINYMGLKLQAYPFLDSSEKNNEMVNEIFLMYKHYMIIKDIFKDEEYYSKLNTIDKSSVDEFLHPYKMRDYSSAFVMILKYGFFDIDEVLVKEMLDFIRNNDYAAYLCKNKLDLMDKNYLYHYISSFVHIKDFSTNDELASDRIVRSILNCTIKDQKTYSYLIDSIDSEVILQAYNNDVAVLFNELDNSEYDDVQKHTIKTKLLKKMLEDEPLDLIDCYLSTKDEKFKRFVSNYEDEIKEIIKNNSYTCNYENIVVYCLENKILSTSLILNIYTKYNNKPDISDKLRKLLNENRFLEVGVKAQYSLDILIEKLKNVIVNKEKLNIMEVVNICDSLTKLILPDQNVCVLFFTKSNKNLGFYFDKDVGYSLDYYSNFKMVNNDEDYEHNVKLLLELLCTIFHETTHYKQFHNENLTEDEKYYIKEKIIRKNYPNYYEKNYNEISYEVNARTKSFELCYEFLNSYVPEAIPLFNKYFMEEYRKDLSIDINNKAMFNEKKHLDIDRIFNRLIYFHPEILEEYPYLNDRKSNKSIK